MRHPSPPAYGLRIATKAKRSDTRSTNLRLVLQHLFSGEKLSRADLARKTGLTPATVSTLVGELASQGLIIEGVPSNEQPKVGKPPTLLKIRADARNVVAIDLSNPDVCRAALIDLAGAVLVRYECQTEDETRHSAVRMVTELAAKATSASDSPLVGIGIATPGVVAGDGTIVEGTKFDWRNLDLRNEVTSSVGLPTYVLNDSNAASIAEYSHGGHQSANLGVITIGAGLGAGFILNGQPFLGANFGAGEIGHMVVDPIGPHCRCGNRGCLETLVSLPVLRQALLANGADIVSIRSTAAMYLGIVMAAIVSILNVDNIIISGPEDVLGSNFCGNASDVMRTRCLVSAASNTQVRLSQLGNDSVVLGAAALVLSQELGIA